LHVGKVGYDGIMAPVLFNEDTDGYKCHLYLNEGEVRDLDGKMLSDNTVVEFYYNDNSETDFRFRWIPIRTRYDKTEASQRHKSNFGNYITTASNVWHSIMVPVIINDFQDLSQDDLLFDKKRELLRSKIGKDIIRSVTKENAYFQQKGIRVAAPFRNFRQNWYTSNLHYTYLNKNYNIDKRKLSVLDIACGRGRELGKFYYCEVAQYVGFDIDSQAINDPTDGAISRYNNNRKKKPNYPKMEFFQADAGSLLNYDDQFKALGGMSSINKTVMEKFCSKDPKQRTKFDRVNCQFALHYFLKNNDTWTNFKQNINDYLKPGGLLLAGGIFDAKQLIKYLGDKDRITEYFTDENGDKKILWEVIKKFDLTDNKKITIGYAVDFYAAWLFFEGTYQTEYLVDKDFLINEFSKDCDLELVETDLFSTLFDKHYDFITNYSKFERNKTETLKFLNNVKEYYKDDPINLACRLNDKITRYYVFRKRESQSTSLSIKEIKGGKIKKIPLSDNSYYKSIHDILRTHKIIPKTIDFEELFKSLDINTKKVDFKIGDKLIVEHQLKNGKTRKTLNGVNIHIQEDGSITEYKSSNPKAKTIILIKNKEHYEPYYETYDEGVKGFF
jgi:SAM-dependent methyltransferase